MYAIIETGGKQYRVTPGQVIEVENMGAAEGEVVNLDKVLLIAEGDKLTTGAPTIEGAKVIATSQGESKGEKVAVFKFQAKKRHTKKTGHRQSYTRLSIYKIVKPGEN